MKFVRRFVSLVALAYVVGACARGSKAEPAAQAKENPAPPGASPSQTMAASLSKLTEAAPAAAPIATRIGGRIDARMMRYPDVSATQIAFVYAGDIWLAPKTGGTAVRLSSPLGEEAFPRFSPDGSRIAYSANYDGNMDVYVVSASGGLPERVTHHPMPDRLIDWTPDGNSLIYATQMTSGSLRFNQLYKVNWKGGLPEKLPVPYGEFGSISDDGKTLAYTILSQDFRTWKRYRGGTAPDIWTFDLASHASKNVTHDEANDAQPMWHGSTLYFLSDRDKNKRGNIWAYDTTKDSFRQVTFFEEYDVEFPAVGPTDMVFENGDLLYVMNLVDEKYGEVKISVVTDRATLKPRTEKVAKLIQTMAVSPTGKRAILEARGELFSLPVEHGVIRNLTNSSGVAERHPAWSPDGKTLAYFSDRSGEYELTLRPADESAPERKLTSMGPGFRYRIFWSPDSKTIAFVDSAMGINLCDAASGKVTQIDKGIFMYHGDLAGFTFSWSADSRWVAYSRDVDNRHGAIFIYDAPASKLHQVTSGFYDDTTPAFDPEGKYLYFISGRSFVPTYGDVDNTWIYANSKKLIAAPLRKDVASPLEARNDEEKSGAKDDAKKDGDKKDKDKNKDKDTDKNTDKGKDKDDKDKDKKESDKKKDEKKDEDKAKEEKPKPVEIDLDGFESRLVELPPKPGNYANLQAVKGKLVYRRLGFAGSGEEKSPIVYYDLKEREEKTILDNATAFRISANLEKMIVTRSLEFAIIDVKENQKFDKKLATGDLEMTVDPVEEWNQLFTEAWRLERDFFYDPGMHGVDWKEMRRRYGLLMKDAVTRWDVNFVIGELIGEINSSHTYRSGGDVETAPDRAVGLLGADYALENGAFRIKKIVRGAPWDIEARAPLAEPGIKAHEGDYLLAVNGVPVDTSKDPWAAFGGLAGKTVELTLNDKPTMGGARKVLVQTVASEARLRNLEWIEGNRKKVDTATGGKVGYVYVPDTGANGQNELVRQYRPQVYKDGIIIDERFNSGGQIPDRFVELLNRPLLSYYGVRNGTDWIWPPMAHVGPMAMLINAWSGSGGDAFPFYFKESGLGPLIGTRTWGGLIGMSGVPPLIDGGSVTVPTFGIYSKTGEWIVEGHGVDPDVEVADDPAKMVDGGDPQLERGIDEVMKSLKDHPVPKIVKPKYQNRAGR